MNLYKSVHINYERDKYTSYHLFNGNYTDAVEKIDKIQYKDFYQLKTVKLIKYRAGFNFIDVYKNIVGINDLYLKSNIFKKSDFGNEYVYFLRANKDSVKIGKSKQPKERIKQISPKMPFEPNLIHTIKTNQGLRLEKLLHELNDDKRKRGEWFYFPKNKSMRIKAMKELNSFYFFDDNLTTNRLKHYLSKKLPKGSVN